MRPRYSVLTAVSLFFLLPLFALGDPASISAARLQSWLEKDNPPLVLDVRGKELYQAGTLPGAVNAGRDPLGYLPDDSKEPVVLILPDEAGAEFAAAWRRRLADAGHEVWVLDRGLDGWKAAGGTVVIYDASYAKPGRVPFVIPRGLCEGNEPAQIYE